MRQVAGRNAMVIDALTESRGWKAHGRFYGFLDRWLSVYVTFDIDDLSPASHPSDDFPFAFNCDMTTPHYVDGEAIYTTDLHLDVLVLADGTKHQLVDVEEFESAYQDGQFGRVWYDGARREADRVMEEARTGRFVDMLREAAPFPDSLTQTKPSGLTELDPGQVEFRDHPRFPRF